MAQEKESEYNIFVLVQNDEVQRLESEQGGIVTTPYGKWYATFIEYGNNGLNISGPVLLKQNGKALRGFVQFDTLLKPVAIRAYQTLSEQEYVVPVLRAGNNKTMSFWMKKDN